MVFQLDVNREWPANDNLHDTVGARYYTKPRDKSGNDVERVRLQFVLCSTWWRHPRSARLPDGAHNLFTAVVPLEVGVEDAVLLVLRRLFLVDRELLQNPECHLRDISIMIGNLDWLRFAYILRCRY